MQLRDAQSDDCRVRSLSESCGEYFLGRPLWASGCLYLVCNIITAFSFLQPNPFTFSPVQRSIDRTAELSLLVDLVPFPRLFPIIKSGSVLIKIWAWWLIRVTSFLEDLGRSSVHNLVSRVGHKMRSCLNICTHIETTHNQNVSSQIIRDSQTLLFALYFCYIYLQNYIWIYVWKPLPT